MRMTPIKRCDFVNPRTSCINLLRDMVHLRKDTLPALMPALSATLNRYAQMPPAQRTADRAMCFEKDGALYAVGALAEMLQKKQCTMAAGPSKSSETDLCELQA